MIAEVILSGIMLGAVGLLIFYFFLQPSAIDSEEYIPVKKETTSKVGTNNRGSPQKRHNKHSGRRKKKLMHHRNKTGGTKTKGCENDLFVGMLHIHRGDACGAAWSPSGKMLVSIDDTGLLRAFINIKVNGKKVTSDCTECRDIHGAFGAICLPSDDMLVVGLSRKRLAFVRLAIKKNEVVFTLEREVPIQLTFQIVQMISGEHVSLKTIIFMRDLSGEYVESIGLDGESYGRVKIKQGGINDMQLSPDAKLLTVCTGQSCNVFAVKPGKGNSLVHGCLTTVAGTRLPRKGADLMKTGTTSAAFSDDGKCIAVAGIDGKIMVFSCDINWLGGQSPKLLKVIEPEIEQDMGLIAVANNKQVIVSSGCFIRAYGIENGDLLDEVTNATKFVQSKIKCLLWRSSCNMFMTFADDKRITLWKPTSKGC